MVRRLWPLRPQVHMEPRDSPILQRSEPGLHGLTRSSGVLREFGGKKGSCPLHRRICLLHRPDLSVAYIFRSMQQTDTSMQWTAAFFFFSRRFTRCLPGFRFSQTHRPEKVCATTLCAPLG